MSTGQVSPEASGSELYGATSALDAALTQFVVRIDGSVRGDDLAAGTVASAMPYYGRLGRRVGELVDAGEPVAFETIAATRLTVQVTWTLAGEGLFRAVVRPVLPREVPSFTVVGGATVDAALTHCVHRLAQLPGAHWAAVLTSDMRVVAAAGHDRKELHHLPETGSRMLAMLAAIDDRPGEAFARVDFDGVSVVAATLGRHCLFALTERKEEAELAPVIDEVRAILAPHDLLTATTLVEAADVAPVAGEEPVLDKTDLEAARRAAAALPAPVGARFRGVRQPRRRGRG
jgi:hypothetical protein